MKHVRGTKVLLFIIMPLMLHALDTKQINLSLTFNLDDMVNTVQKSKQIMGFEIGGYSKFDNENSLTSGKCNELLNAIQNNKVTVPKPIASNHQNYEDYYKKVSSIVVKYSNAQKERLKLKGDSSRLYDDEISPLLEKSFYKHFSLLSYSTEKNRLQDKPYKIFRALYQSSVDKQNNPRYFEVLFKHYPGELHINSISLNVLSMDGQTGHSLTAYDYLHVRNETHLNTYGLFDLNGMVYIWLMESKPKPNIQDWIHYSRYIVGPKFSNANKIVNHVVNTKWAHDLFIASPTGTHDESNCQFYLEE